MFKSGQTEVKHEEHEDKHAEERADERKHAEELEEPSRATNPSSSMLRIRGTHKSGQPELTQAEESEERSRAANPNSGTLRNARNLQERPTRNQTR